jgi:hypothetical protein
MLAQACIESESREGKGDDDIPSDGDAGDQFDENFNSDDEEGAEADESDESVTRENSVLQSQLDTFFSNLKKEESTEFQNIKKGNLWIEPSNPLTALVKSNPDPSKFYEFKLFTWIPHITWPQQKLSCIKYNNASSPCKGELRKKGAASNPRARRVLSIDHCYYLIGYQYQCDVCHLKTYSTSTEFLAKLPEYITLQFPCILTTRLAADIKVSFFLKTLITSCVIFCLLHQK